MSTVCSFVPNYYLQRIIDSGTASAEEIHACQVTIDQSRTIRDARIEYCSHQPSVQQAISNLANVRTHGLNRTIYDARGEEDTNAEDPVRVEGGPPVPLQIDQSNDANECYDGFKKAYDFLLEFFGLDSLDGEGLPLRGFVNYGKDLDNAMWNGRDLLFGRGTLFNGLTDELDVIAHEMGHGIIQHTANLRYINQSGALNESIADVFGIMVKQWGEKSGSPQTAEESNWLIGEGIWRSTVRGEALRNMKTPGTAFDLDDQPAHWKNFRQFPVTKDKGGVHVNSGIPNRAFFLAAIKIGGFSWEGAGQVWYKALTKSNLNKTATFKEFADATITHAGEHVASVKEAWNEVGYPFPPHRREL